MPPSPISTLIAPIPCSARDSAKKRLRDLDAALKLDATFFDALIERGMLLLELGRFDEARKSLDAAHRADPDHPEPFFYRSVILERKGDIPGALAAIEESLKRDPDSDYALNNKGNLLLDLSRVDEALLCFETIIARNDQYALAHYNRACVYALRNDPEEAAKSLARAIALDSRFVEEARNDADFDTIRRAAPFAALLLVPESDS